MKRLFYLYRNNLKNRESVKEAPRFLANFVGAEAAKLKKFSDGGGTKSGGCPTPAETDSSSCFGIFILLSRLQNSLINTKRMWGGIGVLQLALLAGCHHASAPVDPIVAIQIQDRNGLTETISTPDRLQNYQGVDFLSSQPYKKVLRVYRNEGKNHSVITTYHSNGSPWQYLEAEEMRAHGAYREWFPNGQLRIDAKVIGGTADVGQGAQQDWLFEGVSQVWDEKGRLVAQIPYKKGMLEGLSLYFYPSGQLEKEIPYVQNAVEGEVLEFFSNGELRSKTEYKKGYKEGLSVGFFNGEKPAWTENYAEGLIVSATYLNPEGAQVAKIEKGAGFQAHFEAGHLLLLVEYRQGKPEGSVYRYTPLGELQTSYTLKNGKKQGEEIEYYLSSQRQTQEGKFLPKISLHWNENAIHGTAKTWYSNGQLQSQREYCRNQKLGPAIAWYRDGSLMLVEEYEEDRLTKGQYYKIHQRDPVSSVVNGTGTATLYDEEGSFLRKVNYVKGKPVDPES